MPHNKKLFLSAVRSEFISCLSLLARGPKCSSPDIAVQEDFVVTGGSTLEKIDTYMLACGGIIRLIDNATGAALLG